MTDEGTYTVRIVSKNCLQQPDCIPQCSEVQCKYLCRHMVQCTCFDYVHGHLCKHAHKVNLFALNPDLTMCMGISLDKHILSFSS